MKKKIVAWTCLLTICFLLFGCKSKYISKSEAQDIVLNDSHWNRGDVVFTETELDRDTGLYEIEFIANGEYEYEYQVNAKNGEIIVDDDFVVYSVDDAKNIAILDAGLVESDVSIISNKEENEDGLTVYEIKFSDELGYIYEYEISAKDGTILGSEKEKAEKDD